MIIQRITTLADNELVAIPTYLIKGNRNKNSELQFISIQCIKTATDKVWRMFIRKNPPSKVGKAPLQSTEDFLALVPILPFNGKYWKCWQQNQANDLSDF